MPPRRTERPQDRVVAAVRRLVDAWRGAPLGAATERWTEPGRYEPVADGERPISETTGTLLRHWFRPEPHVLRRSPPEFRYWPHQRRLVETFVYLHEVRGVRRAEELWRLAGEEPAFSQRDPWPKLGGQLATGSGKTKMMSLLIAWGQLNAVIEGEDHLGLGRHAMVIAPGLFVRDRLLQDFLPPDGGPSVFRSDPVVPPELEGDWDLQVYDPASCPRRLDPDRGALVVTNYHQLLREDESAPEPGVSGRQLHMLFEEGEPRRLEADDTPLLARFRRSRGLFVLNDEAHHVWDESGHGRFEASAAARRRLGQDAQEAMAWIRSIRALNGSADRDGRVGLQADLSATLFEEQGAEQQADATVFRTPTLFRHTAVDYPLAEAIGDGIVKRPILERVKAAAQADGTPEPLVRSGQPDAWRTYEPLLVTGIRRWMKVRDQMRVEGDARKPLLFLLCQNAREAKEIANFLTYREASGEDLSGRTPLGWKDEETGEALFLETRDGATRSTVVQIHIGAKEQSNEKEWASVRAAVNAVDHDTHLEVAHDGTRVVVPNPYNVVVSVMMLKEGWDVRNVKVIVPLRTCDSRTLTEQTLGRGLRKMHAPLVREDGSVQTRPEDLYVIEHPSFRAIIDQIDDLVEIKDGDEIDHTPDYVPIVPREPKEAREAVDVRLVRFEGIRRSREGWRGRLRVRDLPTPAQRFEWREGFSDTEISTSLRAAGMEETEGLRFTLTAIPVYRDYDHVIEAAYARPLIADIQASATHKSDVKLVVKEYLETRTFKLPMGVPLSFDRAIEAGPEYGRLAIGNLLRSDVIQGVQDVLRGPLRDAVHGRVSTEEAVLGQRLASELGPYQAVREHVLEGPSRTVFTRAAFDSADELRAAVLLDACPEVLGWLYNHRSGVSYTIEYDWRGYRCQYYPDFLVRAHLGGRVHNLLVEVKGRMDDRDRAKINAGRRAAALLGRHDLEPWHFLLLLENASHARKDLTWWESMSSASLAQVAAHVESFEGGTGDGFEWRWRTNEEVAEQVLGLADGEDGLTYERLLAMGPNGEADPDRALLMAENLAGGRRPRLARVFRDIRSGREVPEEEVVRALARGEEGRAALEPLAVSFTSARGPRGC